MKSSDRHYWTVPALAVLAAACGYAYLRTTSNAKPAPQVAARPAILVEPAPRIIVGPPETPKGGPADLPPNAPAAPDESRASPQAPAPAPQAQPKPPKKRPAFVPAAPPTVPIETARGALALVGADPQAEAVWANAINDPNLSPHDRKDLIEDLNETGFADPKNLTRDDLPMIANRMALIEAMAPDAMDDTNLAAFGEAYKDLSEMYARLTGP